MINKRKNTVKWLFATLRFTLFLVSGGVSVDDSGFVIRWEGDIEEYPYTSVTINEGGEFERFGRR